MVRTQILKARDESRDRLVEWGNTRTSEGKLTFNFTYYPPFQHVRSILQELQMLLVPDQNHKKVFLGVPIMGFRNGNSLKDCLVIAVLPKMGNTGDSEPCEKSTCQVCDHIITTNTFTTKGCGEVLKIQSGTLNCDSKTFLFNWNTKFLMVVYMFETLKKSSTFGLIIITVNTNLFEKPNRMYHRSFFINTIFKIASKSLMIGKSLCETYKKNFKKGNFLAIQIENILPRKNEKLEKIYIYFNHTQSKMVLAII